MSRANRWGFSPRKEAEELRELQPAEPEAVRLTRGEVPGMPCPDDIKEERLAVMFWQAERRLPLGQPATAGHCHPPAPTTGTAGARANGFAAMRDTHAARLAGVLLYLVGRGPQTVSEIMAGYGPAGLVSNSWHRFLKNPAFTCERLAGGRKRYGVSAAGRLLAEPESGAA